MTHSTTVSGIAQGGPLAWILASDIAGRLRELLAVCGWNQQQMAERVGVRPAQVGVWLAGTQIPAKSRLAAWARREGWPQAIFEDGGPMPRDALNRLAAARSLAEATPGGRSPGRRAEDVRLRAAAKQKDAARLDVIARLIRAYRDAGKAPGPGTLDEWLDILASNGDASPPGESPPDAPRQSD